MQHPPCLSVVVPCFNEVGTVATLLESVLSSSVVAEIVVVDDGSTDGTADALATIDDPRVRVFTQPTNLGKGAAVRRGFAEATADYVVVQDADLEYDPAEFPLLLEPLLDGRADVVYGSRFSGGDARRVLYFWHSMGNKVLTLASNAVTNLNLTDMETCYKMFRREVLDSIEIEEDRFGLEPELTAKVAAGGWRVYEVGISYSGRTYAEGKKIGWRDGVKAMYCIARYSRPGLRWFARHGPPATDDDLERSLTGSLEALEGMTVYPDWIVAEMAPHLGERILEVGAGHGSITERLARHGHVTAMDTSAVAAARLRERFDGDPRVDVVDTLAAAGDGFDAAVLVNVLEHVPDHVGLMRELHEMVRPGGTVTVFVPAHSELYSEFDRAVGHVRRYRASTLAEPIAAGGFDIVELRYMNRLGAVAWFVGAVVGGSTSPGTASTWIYDRLMVPVARWIDRRSRASFGQSLLAIGRRPAAGSNTDHAHRVATWSSRLVDD